VTELYPSWRGGQASDPKATVPHEIPKVYFVHCIFLTSLRLASIWAFYCLLMMTMFSHSFCVTHKVVYLHNFGTMSHLNAVLLID